MKLAHTESWALRWNNKFAVDGYQMVADALTEPRGMRK